MLLTAIVSGQSMSISGPTEVCPIQEYTYTFNPSFLFGACGPTSWWVLDANDNIIDSGLGGSATISFSNPDNQVFKVRASSAGGIGCLGSATKTLWVTTKYPIPDISGPQTMCASGTATFSATVNASGVCFHHKLNWSFPSGWSATFSAGNLVLQAPASVQSGYYTVSARVWYDDRNEYGSWRNYQFWVGKPKHSSTTSSLTGPTSTYTNSNVSYQGATVMGVTSYQWILPSDWALLSSPGKNVALRAGSSLGIKTIIQRSRNSCGYIQDATTTRVRSRDTGGGGNPGSGGGPGGGPVGPLRVDEGGLIEQIAEEEILPELYPNPATDQVFIRLSASPENELSTLRLYDLKGALLSEEKFSGTDATLDLSNLEEGIYLVTLENKLQSIRKRLSVEK